MDNAPSTTIAPPATLDHVAALYDAYQQALGEIEKWTEAAEMLKRRLQQEMGPAEEATIAGRQVFTWRHTGQFNVKRFTSNHPDVALKYTRQVTTDVLDQEALKAELPDLFRAYRGRRFEAKG